MDTSGLIVIAICFTLMGWGMLGQFLKKIDREASFAASLLFVCGSLVFWYYLSKYLLGVK